MELGSHTGSESGQKPSVHFREVSVTAEGGTILESISATVPAGGCTCIVGPNGAGKTTLVLAFLGQIPYQGSIRTEPSASEGPPRIGYVPQRLMFDRGMPLTVEEFLVMGRQWRPLWLGTGRPALTRARELLESVEARHLASRKVGALSGGELQRVLLALALEQDPDVLVLDEPAAGLDYKGEHLLCELLERLRGQRGFTQIMVTHDLGLVSHHATHAILLNRRLIAEGSPKEILTPERLAAAYGLHMGGMRFPQFTTPTAGHGH